MTAIVNSRVAIRARIAEWHQDRDTDYRPANLLYGYPHPARVRLFWVA